MAKKSTALLDLINGTEGDDNFLGTRRADEIYGLGGDDYIRGRSGNDTINGGEGDDSLYGEDGDDVLNGGEGRDSLYGGLGDDVLNGGGDSNTLFGREGNDTLNAGNEGDRLDGGTGADVLNGGDGYDELDGGTGVDTMTGGEGGDIYHVDNQNDQVVEVRGGGNDLVYSSVSYTLSLNVEALVLGLGNINGTGNYQDNVIRGNSGRNRIDGRDGDDNLSGAGGNDTILGGGGSDTLGGSTDASGDVLIGGRGNDNYDLYRYLHEIQESADAGVDRVSASQFDSYTLPDNVENLYFSNSGDGYSVANGNDLDNYMDVNAEGGGEVHAGGGNDIVLYSDHGEGAEGIVYGDEGDDTLTYFEREGSGELHGGGGNDTLFAWNAARLYGGSGDDSLSGLEDNLMDGGSGNDRIELSEMGDVAIGGAGNDRFDLTSAWNTDEGNMVAPSILDFEADADRIYYFVNAEVGEEAIDEENFYSAAGAAAVAQTEEQKFIFDTAGGILYYDYDGSGENIQTAIAYVDIQSGTMSAANIYTYGITAA